MFSNLRPILFVNTNHINPNDCQFANRKGINNFYNIKKPNHPLVTHEHHERSPVNVVMEYPETKELRK